MKLKWTAVQAAGLAFMLWGGCTGVKVPPKHEPCILDELRQGDMVTMNFTDLPLPGIPEQKVRVKDDGTLGLPHNLSVAAAGKKLGVVEREIHDLLVPKYYRQLSVALKTEDRFYFVGGEVRSPGRQLFLGETTVLRAIQSCGDFTDFANRHSVIIHRANGKTETIDCTKALKDPRFDLPICPGDSIVVKRRWV